MKKLFTNIFNERFSSKPYTLTRQLMTPLAILVLVSFIGISVVLYQLHRHYLHDTFTKNIASINSNMDVLLNQQSDSLSLTLNLVASDPAVQKALEEKNSTALLRLSSDI